MAARLLITSGSSRAGSLNTRLAAVAAQVARGAGAEVTELDLSSLGLPVYSGDIEAAGLPAGALELRRLFAAHDAFIVAAPEYNAFITPLLLNSLDWASRAPASGDLPAGVAAMSGTVAGMLSASPGALGGMRGLLFLRSFLSTALGMLVVPETASVGTAHQAFDEHGTLKEAKQQQAVERVVHAVLKQAAA
jgi:chromate reductase, NAD(P)H dehydrogenase (quinone)